MARSSDRKQFSIKTSAMLLASRRGATRVHTQTLSEISTSLEICYFNYYLVIPADVTGLYSRCAASAVTLINQVRLLW